MTCQCLTCSCIYSPKRHQVWFAKGGEIGPRRAQEIRNSLRHFISVSFSRHSLDTLFCTRYQEPTCLTTVIHGGDTQFLAALGCSALGCNRTRRHRQREGKGSKH